MDVEEFIASQQEIIAEHGIDEYVPVVFVEGWFSIKVSVLSDPPEGTSELETVARDWARHVARKRDYLLAFRSDASHFKIIARIKGETTERIVAIDES